MDLVSQAIIKTLCYSDIFDFPLTQAEIIKKLITPIPVAKKEITDSLKKLSDDKRICIDRSYYYLPGREKIVNSRLERLTYSVEKQKKATAIAAKLITLPFIEAVFLTGSVAVNNAKNDDDIDIMIVTDENSLYSGRFFANIWLELKGYRRHPNQNKSNNKICPNLFVTTKTLRVPNNQQNLYTAHEVFQTLPLADKNNWHQSFQDENEWIRQYLANPKPKISINKKKKSPTKAPVIIETTLRLLQLAYMFPKKTRELVTPTVAYFHPRDTAGIILNNYSTKISDIL